MSIMDCLRTSSTNGRENTMNPALSVSEVRRAPKRQRKPSRIVRLLEVMPEFCWQTTYEILTMFEQIDDDVLPNSLKTLLYLLHKNGYLDRRPALKHHEGELIESNGRFGNWHTHEYKRCGPAPVHIKFDTSHERVYRIGPVYTLADKARVRKLYDRLRTALR